MDFKILKEALDNNQRQNFYVFTGEETEIMRKYIKRIDPNAREAESFQSLIVRFQNVGLFNNGEHGTYYIYEDKTILSMDIKHIIKLIGPDKVVLIYKASDERTTFFKSVKQFTYEFPKLDSQKLAQHVQNLIDINDKVALEICRLCNNEVSRIELECDKLSRLGREITISIVVDIITKNAEDVIFDMIKSVVKKKVSTAYSYYEDLKDRKESPIKIISLLYTQFRNILLIQSYKQSSNQEIATKTGLSTGQIYYMKELTGSFSIETLKDHLISIQQAEVDIKTGRLDQHIALDVLLLSILR
jgi:DNA polymerase-3 subunit delta